MKMKPSLDSNLKPSLCLCVALFLLLFLLTPIRPFAAQTLETRQSPESKRTIDPQADLPWDTAERNPTVDTVLQLPRETPADSLVAIFTLLDLGEDRKAEKLLAPLVQRQLTPDECARLVARFGSAKFLRLARLERPGNELVDGTPRFTGVRQFAETCLQEAADRARDPKRIASLVAQLHDPKAEVRYAARVDLQATGLAGVIACLHALAAVNTDSMDIDSQEHQEQRAHLMAALAGLHPATDAPLLAMLASCDGLLARDLAEVAGHLRLSAAIPWLAKLVACAPEGQAQRTSRQALAEMGISTPTPEAVRALAVREINRLQKVETTHDRDQAVWWTWSPVKGSPVKGSPVKGSPVKGSPVKGSPVKGSPVVKRLTAHEVSPDQLKTLTLARLSSLLTSCHDPTPSERQLALIYCLEAIPWIIDSQKRTPTALARELVIRGKRLTDSMTADQLSATLDEAIRRGQLKAAIAVTRQLGQLGNRAAVTSQQERSRQGTSGQGRLPLGRPSPLVRTLRHPNTELRFAALSAIMELAPEHSFAGSSYLPEALWTFSRGHGPLEALVVSPLARRRSAWAGQLREMGYEAIPAATGRETLLAATRSSRLAFILADASVSRPAAREIHYQLRASTQTGNVPMAIVCDGAGLLDFDRLAATDPLLLVAVRPANQVRLAEIVERLQQLANPPVASDAVRLQRAEQALDWLTQLIQLPSTVKGNVYQELRRGREVVEQTLFQPELVTASLRLLEHLGTSDSQLKLLDYASGKTLPMENRRAAAKGFAANVDQYGILLTTEQIRTQYDRYNASESDNRPSQQVLGELLDVLENRGTDH
jgi:CheY-like chemotaxis protein